MKQEVKTVDEMKDLGRRIGSLCHGGEVIELIGDVGAGKTVLTKGIAAAMGVDEEVQSPTFTLSRLYDTASGGQFAHYDFYRLNNPGILSMELAYAVSSPETTVVIEWADVVDEVLPEDRLRVDIKAVDEFVRSVDITAGGDKSQKILDGLR